MMQRSSTTRKQGVDSWTRHVFRKWLKFSKKGLDSSADDGENKSDLDEDEEEEEEEEEKEEMEGVPCMLRRTNSETLRFQYIDAKDVRVCVGTWNVGGKIPQDDLDIEEWIDPNDPADIYVLGIQEIVPLNAGNIFGTLDTSPVPVWENIIRQSLNKVRMKKLRYKCHSDPPSPSRFKPSDNAPAFIEELFLPETDSDSDDERIHPLDELQNETDDLKHDQVSSCTTSFDENLPNAEKLPSMKRLNKCHKAIPKSPQKNKLIKTLSSSEMIGLAWPEQPLDLLAKCASDRPKAFRSQSLKACSSFKSAAVGDCKDPFEFGLIPEFDHGAAFLKKKTSSFVKIISKQMVGIFISIWVRRSLRKQIHNLKVSVVGVGAMGYTGNKGSIAVSMSIYQTQFCFICVHLSSGEKTRDELRRNTDVQEIHRRTRFIGLAKMIQDHERIFWFGDLNYRINLSYERAHELISAKKWSELVEKDQLQHPLQLKHEPKKGRAFDGWAEGKINFPPTYKYDDNSEKYIGQDSKGGRRTPAWCDRILTFGKGMKLLSYRRSELKLSDHRPVTATYLAEVEVFSHKKLQRALTLTDAEIDGGKIITSMDGAVGMGPLMFGKNVSQWER